MQNGSKSRLSRLAENLNEYRGWATLALQQVGKSFLTQIRENRVLKRTRGQCGISDYFWYELNHDNYLMGRDAQDFLGWRLEQNFSFALNPRIAILPAWDKSILMVTLVQRDCPSHRFAPASIVRNEFLRRSPFISKTWKLEGLFSATLRFSRCLASRGTRSKGMSVYLHDLV